MSEIIINAAEAMELLKKHHFRGLKETITDAPEIVRCRDCKYWQDNNGSYPNKECRWGHEETPDPDDFCSYGERRES